MMIHYYIFNNGSRAAHYGIGTYVGQLTEALRAVPDVRVIRVDLNAEVREFTVTTDDRGITRYEVPSVRRGQEDKRVCRNVAHLLAPYVDPTVQNVFHFNYLHHYPLAMALKVRFMSARVVLAVHYLGWCFSLNGNVSRFRAIIAGSEADGQATDAAMAEGIRAEFARDGKFMHLADYVVVLSDWCRRLLTADYGLSPDKVRLVRNGLDDAAPAAAGNGPDDGTKWILFVGRLDAIKGTEYLFDAFREVLRTHPEARLAVVGDGDYNACLKHCAECWHRVTFTGHLNPEQLAGFYGRAAVGVLPSFHEQCSYSAIELMRHGIPFVGTDSTGLREMLEPVGSELCVSIDEAHFSAPDFTRQLARRLSHLLDHAALRRQAGRTLREQYLSHYTLTAMTSGMTGLIGACRSTQAGPGVPPDMLPQLDGGMVSLVHRRPDIDAGFYGLAGVGTYLWWRMQQVGTTDEARYYYLAEYLIYFIDWLADVALADPSVTFDPELSATLRHMRQQRFYTLRLEPLLAHCSPAPAAAPEAEHIVGNALRIVQDEI